MPDNIILCAAFGLPEMTKMTYDTMLRHTEKSYKGIFLDNGFQKGKSSWDHWMNTEAAISITKASAFSSFENKGIVTDTDPIVFAASDVNGGCGRGRNICLELMDKQIETGRWEAPRYVTLIDNDIILTPGWDTEMIQFMDTHPQVGLCGPMTNWAGTPQLISKKEYSIPGGDKDREANPLLIPEIEKFAVQFKEKNKQKYAGVPGGFIVIGFVMMIRWEAYKQLGHFDQQYRLYGYEDTDYCNRARKAGWKLAYFNGCYVHHWGSKSVTLLGEEFHKVWNENKAVYEKAWGKQ